MERCVLEGMVNILLRDRPVIIVEQKKHKDALSYLEQIGFKKIAKLNGDYIFV
jgi:hypothetical protein